MKRILFVLAIATVATSCNSREKREQEAAMKAQQYTMDSMRQELAKQRVIDSMNAVALALEEEKKEAERVAASRSSSRSSRSSGSRSNYYSAERPSAPAPTVVYENPAVPSEPQKKRWSSKATGALIGAGAGALGGALISNKKGKGAVIGGVSGAAVGLGAGAIIDANKKKKEQERQEQQR